jgi:hypothetical protein
VIAGWAPNARTVLGIGPVAVVEDQGLVFFFLGLEEDVASDGAVGVEERMDYLFERFCKQKKTKG